MIKEAVTLVKYFLIFMGVCAIFGTSMGLAYGIIKQTFILTAKLFL